MALPYTAASHIVKVYDWLINQLWPIECGGCGKEGAWLCSACETQALAIVTPTCPFCDRISPLGKTCIQCKRGKSLTGARSVWYYRPPVDRLIRNLKYRSLTGSVRFFALHLAPLVQELPVPKTIPLIITCVPTSLNRKMDRGYNQSELLARAIAKELSLPFVPLLKRAPHAPSQTKLSRTERFANMDGQFSPLAPGTQSPSFVILVDDVITTGATLNACAATLKDMGARSVWGLTIAKD